METEKLRAYLTALETGSLSAAAQRLGYTVSGISRMMASLEEEFGVPLLLRGKDGVAATREGEEIAEEMRRTLFHSDLLSQNAARLRGVEEGSIFIGSSSAGYFQEIAQDVRSFRRRHPGIRFRFVGGYSTELLEELKSHRIDLCISSLREGSFRWKMLGEDEMVAWVPRSGKLASLRALPLEALQEVPFIDILPGKDIDNHRILKKNNIRPNVQYETMDSETAWSMVGAGLGVAMHSRKNSIYRGADVRILPLSPRVTVQMGIAFLDERSPAAEAFLRTIGVQGAELKAGT